MILVASLLLAACSETTPEQTRVVAGVAELTGPYQAEPFQAFDPVLVARLRDACIGSFGPDSRQTPVPGLEVALLDGRGGGRFMVMLTAPTGSAACAGSLDASGATSIEGGSTSGGAIGPREISTGFGMSNPDAPPWTGITGRAGSEVGSVVVELRDGAQVTASLSGGLFAAWWPTAQQSVRFLVFDRNGNLLPDALSDS
jgi:hypothetical protein